MKRVVAPFFLVALVAVPLFWSSCGKCGPEADDTYDYELPDNIQAILPYAVGDSFYMVDTLGNPATFAVMTWKRTQPQQPRCECCPAESADHLEVNVNRDAAANGLQFVMSVDGSKGTQNATRFTCWVESSAFHLQLDSLDLVAVAPHTASKIDYVQIGSHTYLNVYEVHNGATDSTKASTLWYSTQSGVLKYRKVNGEVWSLP